jgi:hypothetical protein
MTAFSITPALTASRAAATAARYVSTATPGPTVNSAAVAVLADRDSGDDELGRGTRPERQHTDRDRSRAGDADMVFALHLGEELERFVGLDPGRDTAAGEADTIADEEVAVTAGEVVEVHPFAVGPVVPPGDRSHRDRVPRRSWVIPPLSNRCSASANPASTKLSTITVALGR